MKRSSPLVEAAAAALQAVAELVRNPSAVVGKTAAGVVAVAAAVVLERSHSDQDSRYIAVEAVAVVVQDSRYTGAVSQLQSQSVEEVDPVAAVAVVALVAARRGSGCKEVHLVDPRRSLPDSYWTVKT